MQMSAYNVMPMWAICLYGADLELLEGKSCFQSNIKQENLNEDTIYYNEIFEDSIHLLSIITLEIIS